MQHRPNISIIIPAINEEESIGLVLNDIPKDMVKEIIVVDNGSHDNTANVAKNLGAKIMSEPLRGYGSACLRGISVLKKDTDIVVFLDADYSDYPQDMHTILKPILTGNAEMVIGSRMLGVREKGALLPQALFGNKLAAFLIRLFWRFRYTDLGPFRAIRYKALLALNMADKNFGWTVEMQIKALKKGFRIMEVPVRYRRRIGKSKITGTLSGTVRAGTKNILFTFLFFNNRVCKWIIVSITNRVYAK
jgi:glycosyltransferase involved in cell wall biosynthesis